MKMPQAPRGVVWEWFFHCQPIMESAGMLCSPPVWSRVDPWPELNVCWISLLRRVSCIITDVNGIGRQSH